MRAGPIAGITLRPVVAADLPILYRQQLDPDANRVAVANPRDLEAFHAHWDAVLADDTNVARAITADERVLGSISSFEQGGRRWIGYWIGREHWGQRVATTAIRLLVGELSARPLHARVARSNVASLRALERNGFLVIGHELAPATERFPECEEALLVLPGP